MRRITLWAFSTVAALVLLFSYRTSTNSPVSTPEAVATAGPAPSGSPNAEGDGGTFDGSSVPTNWGPVQVRITVADGKITQVEAPVSPADDPADAGVTKGALPSLYEQTLAEQSADIDSVSGATFTSAAYKESLQAALDSAQLG
ncbi:FMN-binding protein [Paractinoplanes lichenicola]|uniref:FMN-binding protein n=1 Tax=Paractinoplanes lichenicola TaxID=2802976 RepID=A0ABS1VW42_9ACTN|nr:FMN-binding protein [Actinoplanes lichenicola]MBL7258709.1 FMN-binding protein [Actinoplanes lichenicola]